mgnify:FL=1
MSKLFDLKEWLTLEETAKHLSNSLSEKVSVANVLQLALDEKLMLSVNIPSPCHVSVRKGEQDGRALAPEPTMIIGAYDFLLDVGDGAEELQCRLKVLHYGKADKLNKSVVYLLGDNGDVYELPVNYDLEIVVRTSAIAEFESSVIETGRQKAVAEIKASRNSASLSVSVNDLLETTVNDLLEEVSPEDDFSRYFELFVWKDLLKKEEERVTAATYTDEGRKEDRLGLIRKKIKEVDIHLNDLPKETSINNNALEVYQDCTLHNELSVWDVILNLAIETRIKPSTVIKQIGYSALQWVQITNDYYPDKGDRLLYTETINKLKARMKKDNTDFLEISFSLKLVDEVEELFFSLLKDGGREYFSESEINLLKNIAVNREYFGEWIERKDAKLPRFWFTNINSVTSKTPIDHKVNELAEVVGIIQNEVSPNTKVITTAIQNTIDTKLVKIDDDKEGESPVVYCGLSKLKDRLSAILNKTLYAEDIYQYALNDQFDIYWYSDYTIRVSLSFDAETAKTIKGSDTWESLLHQYIALPKDAIQVLMSGRDATLTFIDAHKNKIIGAPSKLIPNITDCLVLEQNIKVLRTDNLFVKETDVIEFETQVIDGTCAELHEQDDCGSESESKMHNGSIVVNEGINSLKIQKHANQQAKHLLNKDEERNRIINVISPHLKKKYSSTSITDIKKHIKDGDGLDELEKELCEYMKESKRKSGCWVESALIKAGFKSGRKGIKAKPLKINRQ